MEHLEEFWLLYLVVSVFFNAVFIVRILLSQSAYEAGYKNGKEDLLMMLKEQKAKTPVATVTVADKTLMAKDARRAGFTQKPKVTSYFANKWGVTAQTARKRIKTLLNEGYVEKVGSGRNTAYKLVA